MLMVSQKVAKYRFLSEP